MTDISGIVKNALERGWQKNEIIQSLTNSGYSSQEIESEFQIISGYTSQANVVISPPQNSSSQQVVPIISSKTEIPLAQKNQSTFNPQSLKNYQIPKLDPPKEVPTYVIVILVILLILALTGAGLFLYL